MSISVPLEGFGGGGGASLNFDVKGYATEAELLAATPKENTIGVITDVAISSWVFSATEPTEPVEGMVWITTGTSSTIEFNALKKNAIQVYPLSASQYVGGAWVDVTAMSYQGGEWVEWWNGAIYQNGKFFGVAGELIGTNRIYDATYQHVATAPTITNENNQLTIVLPSVGGGNGSVVTENAVDITGFKKLSVTLSASNSSSSSSKLIQLGLYKELDCAYGDAVAFCALYSNVSKTTYNVDISELTGNYYIGIYIQGYNAQVTVTLHEMALVK